ncbi:MAG: hypothetical protein M1828_002516 [Chrysothrix sp. TS-e1954]|nr:MAG: hypothetical protein M1828_002516 [Chrysothrix sp. TS-e1954]
MRALVLCIALLSCVDAARYRNSRAYDAVKSKRQANQTDSLTVDLGYETYKGVANQTTKLNTFKGIRYAAPPTGQYRWQPPRVPTVNQSSVIAATSFASQCPQSEDAPYVYDPCPGLADSDTLPASCANSPLFQNGVLGSEDCLFLNVYAPQGKQDLPVLVYIHGGGYGAGNGMQDMSQIIQANNNGFVGVTIQYRLGAFGFLSSDEVYRFGSVNAGLLDQHFALQWVHDYISLFGGDPSRVTIAGESAGGGSVMLQDMAFGGTQGDTLFQQGIAASPYLPMQYGYSDWIPTQSYFAFAQKVGCFNGVPYGNQSSSTIFECLVGKDTLVLQQASAIVSATGLYGTWGFLPVTDGTFVQQLPSQQLLRQQVNGNRILSGNNANEGAPFTPQNIETEDDLVAWLKRTFAVFSSEDISKILYNYPSSNASVNANTPLFATTGESLPNALNESSFGTGQQQRADNIYAESTFICPSYWLAQAYAARGPDYAAYKYQYSVPPANHSSDVAVYFGPKPDYVSPEFQKAFMQIWGNFIIHSNPSIPSAVANGQASNASSTNAASDWPLFSSFNPYQMNLNISGGTPHGEPYSGAGIMLNVSDSVEPGLRNDITRVNAYEWEGGREARCQFWRGMGVVVPG